MGDYFLYHSIGMYPQKAARMAAELTRFSEIWGSHDDGQWPYALGRQSEFLDRWRQLINAPEGSLSQCESVTAALHSILRGIPASRLTGGKILIARDCFPSLHFLLAEVARQIGCELVTVDPADGEAFVSDQRMIDAWDKDVQLAILTWVTSTSSHLSDVAALVKHGHAQGSLVVIDVTQGVGIRPYDVAEVGADFTIGSSLKWLCGASGAAIIQASPEMLNDCEPELRGWFSQSNPFNWDLDAFSFAPDARRFGNGTPSPLPAAASLPGLDFVLATGVDALCRDNLEKTGRVVSWAQEAGVDMVSPADTAQRGGSVMLSLPDRLNAAEVVNQLRAQEIHVDARGQILRVSPGIVTSHSGIERLTKALSDLLGRRAAT